MSDASDWSSCGHELHGEHGEHDEPEGADGEDTNCELPSGYEPL
ncbi:hypothetical protein ACIA8E_37885 [Streptomyces sp. NPDC051664]